MKKIWRSLLIIPAFVLMLNACGGGGNDVSNDYTNPPVTEEQQQPEQQPEQPPVQQPEQPPEQQPVQPPVQPQARYRFPTLRIETEQGAPIVSKEEYLNVTRIQLTGQYDFFNPDTVLDDFEMLAAPDSSSYPAQIKGRGNGTWLWFEKKPYRIKFTQKQGLFGLTKAKNWVLIANARDPSLLANAMTFELGRRFNFPFTNHEVFVDLYVNNQFLGNYMLTERVEVNKGRVDIHESKGWLVELDTYFDSDPKWETPVYKLPAMIKSPKDLADLSEYDFVKSDIAELEDAMSSPDFPNNGYRNLIDLDNLVDYIMINEIVLNVELEFPRSVYIYKDFKKGKSEPIRFGPLWDFDYCCGTTDFPTDYFIYHGYFFLNYKHHPFFLRLFQDPEFSQKFKARWAEKFEEIRTLGDWIRSRARYLNDSANANYEIWHSPWDINNGFVYETTVENLCNWLDRRIAFLDSEIQKLGVK